MPAIVPNLWFDTESLEAAEFYVSVFPNSEITQIGYYGDVGLREPGSVMTVDFTLDGKRYTAINGGPQFVLDEAFSLLVECKDQAEVDYYWAALTDGGEESMCGWLKDRFGVSWQVVPKTLQQLIASSEDAMRAMLDMKKIDLAAIEAAAGG